VAITTENEWRRLIAARKATAQDSVLAETVLMQFGTASSPLLIECGDEKWVVKGKHLGRALVNEQVVGRLGMAMGAPVGDVGLVRVTEELRADYPAIPPQTVGLNHGSRFVEGVSERRDFDDTALDVNRDRLALLAILYGWARADDYQAFYRKEEPRYVYSFDHAYFFPGGAEWTPESLHGADAAAPDAHVVERGKLTQADLVVAAPALECISAEHIAEAIGAIPEEWNLPEGEAVALAMYLERRQRELLALLAPPGQEGGDR